MAIVSGTLRRLPSRSQQASVELSVWVEAIFVVAILAIAAGLRFASIGSKSFWADEAYSASLAGHAPREIVTLTAREDAHPPLYYLALSVWSRVVGIDDADLRSLSAVASILTVGGAWWIGRRLGGPATGMLTAFLTAVSPFQVLAAQEARMYALLGFLTVLSWAALLAAIEGGWKWWVIYSAAATLGLYTHYFAFLNILGQGIFVLGGASPRWRIWAISQVAILMLYLPWLSRFLATVTSGQGWPFLRPPVEAASLTALLGLLSFGGHVFGFARWFGGGSASLPLQVAILAPFVMLAALGLAATRRQPRPLWFVIGSLIAPVAAAFAFSLRTNVIYPRYFSFVHVPFALVVAFGMLRLASYVPAAYRRGAGLALGLMFLLVSTPVLRGLYLDPKFEVFNWRSAGTWLEQVAGSNDLIIVTPGYDRLPFSRYFRGPQSIVSLDPVELSDPKIVQLQPAGEARMRALFQSIAESHEVMWVVTDEGLPPAALVRFSTFLEGIYDLQGITQFNAIKVFKTRRHMDGDAPLGNRLTRVQFWKASGIVTTRRTPGIGQAKMESCSEPGLTGLARERDSRLRPSPLQVYEGSRPRARHRVS